MSFYRGRNSIFSSFLVYRKRSKNTNIPFDTRYIITLFYYVNHHTITKAEKHIVMLYCMRICLTHMVISHCRCNQHQKRRSRYVKISYQRTNNTPLKSWIYKYLCPNNIRICWSSSTRNNIFLCMFMRDICSAHIPKFLYVLRKICCI